MSNPQTENGFMRLATELVEAMAKVSLNGNEHRIIFAVWRKTYCWNKKEDWISLSQLEQLTGMNRAAVCRALKSLVSKMILLKASGKISFNKHYNQWVVSEQILVSNQCVGSIKSVLPASINLDTHNIHITKDNNTIDFKKRNLEIDKLKESLKFKKLLKH